MDLSTLIEQRTKDSNKFYEFNENHNPFMPADHWFQESDDGLILFIVFYSQTCRWAQCSACNLPSQMSQYHVPYKHIMKQIDFVFDFLLNSKQKIDLKKIIISNNGSVLDQDTFSTTALIYFLAKMNTNCPNIHTLALETRPEYVDVEELEMLSRAIKEGDTPTNLEVTIGFESFNEEIRNTHFKKGLRLKEFEEMAKKLARYNFKLKTYFMLKPIAGLTEEEAIVDIQNAIKYLDEISNRYNLDINMHLNPTYVAKGTILETQFEKGDYSPPKLESIKEAIKIAANKRLKIFIGLNDEGLAVPGGSFIRSGDEKLIQLYDQFNKTQDYNLING